MSFKLGNTTIGELYVGSNKIAQAYLGSNLVYQAGPGPLPPIPSNTVRVRTNDGNPPTKVSRTSYETATLVPGTTDIYDVYKSGTSFSYLLYGSSNIIEVLGANTSNITDMSYIFPYCTSLTTVQLFDTSNVTNMEWMFKDCTSLTIIPLFNTSKVTVSVNRMCYNCTNVESGALALYQQLSTQAFIPPSHNMTFTNCGSNTTAGAAELAQIPSSWGGTVA